MDNTWIHKRFDSGYSETLLENEDLIQARILHINNNSVSYNHLPFNQQIILFEYLSLPKFVPDGIYVLPILDYCYIWNAVVFIHYGPYAGAIFRFTIEMSNSYPFTIPIVRFKTPLNHPLVDPLTGQLDTDLDFPNWSPLSFIADILVFVKNVLELDTYQLYIHNYLDLKISNPNYSKSKNHHQMKMYIKDYNQFVNDCTQIVTNSYLYMYEDQDSNIVFTPWDLDCHVPLLRKVLNNDGVYECLQVVKSEDDGIELQNDVYENVSSSIFGLSRLFKPTEIEPTVNHEPLSPGSFNFSNLMSISSLTATFQSLLPTADLLDDSTPDLSLNDVSEDFEDANSSTCDVTNDEIQSSAISSVRESIQVSPNVSFCSLEKLETSVSPNTVTDIDMNSDLKKDFSKEHFVTNSDECKDAYEIETSSHSTETSNQKNQIRKQTTNNIQSNSTSAQEKSESNKIEFVSKPNSIQEKIKKMNKKIEDMNISKETTISTKSVTARVFKTNPLIQQALYGIQNLLNNNPQLTLLELTQIQLSPTQLSTLSTGIQHSVYLNKLILNQIPLSSEFIQSLCTSIKTSSLRSLHLQQTGLQTQHLKYFVKTIQYQIPHFNELIIQHPHSLPVELEISFINALVDNYHLLKWSGLNWSLVYYVQLEQLLLRNHDYRNSRGIFKD
ncbi:hypothetical protein BC833DRAFT_596561 [Globomyces pollinis-pini]|nr:hypothetical protein BC833DRAFT_596561 [Globomyces pollinis-pini]